MAFNKQVKLLLLVAGTSLPLGPLPHTLTHNSD